MVVSLPHEGMAKARKKAPAAQPDKYAAIIVDATTGAVISEKNANRSLHPASLTKVMTLMLLFEALENGNVRLNDKIPISAYAASQQPSKLGLTPGSFIRVEDAILAVVTKSANDISVAIGEYLAGTESRFAVRMTRRAHDIGMTRTNFTNASGLHNKSQVSSARDMAILARYVIIRYPNYYRYFGTKQFTYRGKTMTNHNRLMQSYVGMDGFKTGFINQSGFNLIASAKRDGQRLIGVVFGGKTTKSRNDQMASLLDAGFSRLGETRYAGGAPIAPLSVTRTDTTLAVAPQARPPVPKTKPVFKTLDTTPQSVDTAQGKMQPGFTSLSSLDTGRKIVIEQTNVGGAVPAAKPPLGTTEQAVTNAENAIDRGDYSEITGEGDYDTINARRVEAGLIAAAVYKGDHEKVRQIRIAAAANNAAMIPPAAAPIRAQAQPFINGNERQILVAPAGVTPVSLPPQDAAPAASDMWSVQIGAYTSRVATDDALRYAMTKLPADLNHASPIVVPLKSAEGILFRARLGGLSQQQAISACRYFRDCLPVAPR